MVIIQYANDMVISLIGIKFIDNIENISNYKLSKFNNFFEINSRKILYNSFTKAIFELEKSEFDILASKDFFKITTNDLNNLIANGVLRPKKEEENESYLQVYKVSKAFNQKNGYSKYTILPTTACNARCFYCFESNFVPAHMDSDTAKRIAEFITKTKTNGNIKISWFGGEPLCNSNAITQICNILHSNNVDYSSEMLSNGIRFSNDIINIAKNIWNLKLVQISMDGFGDEHNKRKNYCEKIVNPFDDTIEAVSNLLRNGITVKIRINIDLNNIESAEKLIRFLYTMFKDCDNLRVYPAMLYDYSEGWNANRTLVEQELLFQKFLYLTELVYDLKLYRPKVINASFKKNHCIADSPNAIVINQQGDIFSCDHCLPNTKLGNTETGITSVEIYNDWLNNNSILQKCLNCSFLPECTPFGKCPDYNANCYKMMENKVFYSIKSLLARGNT